MDKGATFIKDEFARVELLKESASGSTEIVQGMDKQIFVRKIIPYINLPYTQLATLQHPALPLIYCGRRCCAHLCYRGIHFRTKPAGAIREEGELFRKTSNQHCPSAVSGFAGAPRSQDSPQGH